MLVRAHRAFAQPQHIACLVVQRDGMGSIGFDCRATFWQTASKSTSGLSDCIKALPRSIDPLLKVNTRISTVPALSLM